MHIWSQLPGWPCPWHNSRINKPKENVWRLLFINIVVNTLKGNETRWKKQIDVANMWADWHVGLAGQSRILWLQEMPLSVRAWTLEEGKTKIFCQEPFKGVYKIVLAIGLKICPRQAWKSLTT